MSHRFQQITPTDHFGWHAAYLDVYEKLMGPFKDDSALLIVEIGTDGGGMLLSYADYFGNPFNRIVGLDIAPTPECLASDERIEHFVRDAYTTESVEMLRSHLWAPTFIIDDGPHSIQSQEFFVRNYPQLLFEEGVAIVEDIQQPEHIQHLASCVPEGFFAMGIDLRHINGRYDDILLAVWRK